MCSRRRLQILSDCYNMLFDEGDPCRDVQLSIVRLVNIPLTRATFNLNWRLAVPPEILHDWLHHHVYTCFSELRQLQPCSCHPPSSINYPVCRSCPLTFTFGAAGMTLLSRIEQIIVRGENNISNALRSMSEFRYCDVEGSHPFSYTFMDYQ